MASSFVKYSLLSFVVLISVIISVHCVELDAGGKNGWAIPKSDQFYNDWASTNRFKVNDTLRFTYAKDSVLAVTEEEYEKCRSSHPIFFSNNGDTIFTLEHPGLFYFISGVSGHCERGLKMIIKVLELASPPAQVSNQTVTTPNKPKKNGAIVNGPESSSMVIGVSIVVSLIFASFCM